MSFVCLDISILVKLLTWEDGSEAAADLMERIVESGQNVVLPAFAWAEVGSVLRKKTRKKEITPEEAGEAWRMFRRLRIISYLDNEKVSGTAWEIAATENLPTLYDAAYLAVAEVVAKDSGACDFWTADERLVNSLGDRKKYVRLLEGDG
ncbi:type II toxin-antitoxin system VapC family toxin [Desulfotomaculum copahuensis]|uniref:Twitching motility protein PilT n=1 Tax=Desulfotomaculum copahuensis TaxID=1838280 RepID=A0A1B7LG12_9FIRM|nr:type II toxin-antitoxin system VapC family toxin [Desulfotomaculum copahuensis]OAT83681.1 twitching motility protein PilT [Desulfotomaculum copahuensis]